MGMIFNTDDTLDMIKFVHNRFTTNWASLQANHATWAPRFQNLGTGGAGSTYATVGLAPLTLVNPTAAKDLRWQAWLRLLDGGAAQVIGGFIASAINNSGHTFSGVEFFAVPSAGPITATFADLPDPNPFAHPATSYRKCITINTITIDGQHP
jgi:hypothetical protein